MSVYTKPSSPHWLFDFQIKRHRFYGVVEDETGRPLAKTERRRRAQEREAIIRARAREELATGRRRQRLTLDEALGKYYLEHGQYLPSAPTIFSYAENWRRIGKQVARGALLNKTLDQISDADIAAFVAIRRGEQVGNANPKKLEDGTIIEPRLVAKRTVNADVEFLRAVFHRAAKNWSIFVGDPLNWSAHLLDVPPPPTRVLSAEEDQDLFAAIAKVRPDFADMIEFAVLSGWRLAEVIGLQKRMIDKEARVARVVVKGGEELVRPLTDAMVTIIARNWAHHFTHVFTYVSKANRTTRRPGKEPFIIRKGQRYPFTKNGWRKEWAEFLKESKIAHARFHDLRHTLGTRVYRVTRDIRVVQTILGHKDPATSQRYVHAAGEFERSALEGASGQRVPKNSRPADDSASEN